jgi:ADP-ribose pyrophosphatase YjhB (NUDIX family)
MSHPLDKFRYCPVCGSGEFEINNFKSKKCRDCGFTYYANPCAATAAFIIDDHDNLLAVRRGKEPAKGTLDLPGGFCDMEETVEQGMRREIKEETGLDSMAGKLLGVVENSFLQHGEKHCEINLVYELTLSGGDVAAQEDWIGFEWCPLSNLDAANLLPADIRRMIPENG